MAVYTAPTTRSTGALISASIWNTDIVENLKYFKDAPVFDGDVSVGDDLLLPSTGAVINFANGDVTITHSTNTLTFAGATTGYVFTDGPMKTATTISVGAATPAAAPGAGITFPASQSASSDANTLDDYAEGTWTPVVRGSGTAGTYELQTASGSYTKIGRQVTLVCNLRFAAAVTGGGTGYTQITGIPFNNTSISSAAVIASGLDLSAGYTQLSASPISGSGTSTWYLSQTGDDVSEVGLPIAAVSASDSFWFSATYFA